MEKYICVPVINEKNIIFMKNNEDGTRIYKVADHSFDRPLVFNKTAVYIINQINGKHTVQDILLKLIKKYSKIEKETLEKDLFDLLYKLWNLTLINWVNGLHPFEFMKYSYNGYDFEWLHENEILDNYLSCENYAHHYFTPVYPQNIILNQSFISQNSYPHWINNFQIKKNNEVLLNILFLCNLSTNVLNVIFCDVKVELPDLIMNEFFKWVSSTFKDRLNRDIKRIDLCLLNEDKENTQSLGFKGEFSELKKYLKINGTYFDCSITSYLL